MVATFCLWSCSNRKNKLGNHDGIDAGFFQVFVLKVPGIVRNLFILFQHFSQSFKQKVNLSIKCIFGNQWHRLSLFFLRFPVDASFRTPLWTIVFLFTRLPPFDSLFSSGNIACLALLCCIDSLTHLRNPALFSLLWEIPNSCVTWETSSGFLAGILLVKWAFAHTMVPAVTVCFDPKIKISISARQC